MVLYLETLTPHPHILHCGYINSVRAHMKINEQTYQSVIGVLVLIIIFLIWWMSAHPGEPIPGMTSGVATTTQAGDTGTVGKGGFSSAPDITMSPTTMASGEAISIASQTTGMTIAVSSLTLSQPGWIAVRDSSGRTLGAAWFDTGTRTGVSVPLLRGTSAGQSYQALLYADDGDHQFDLRSDILITNSDGSVAGTTFSVQ